MRADMRDSWDKFIKEKRLVLLNECFFKIYEAGFEAGYEEGKAAGLTADVEDQ